MLKKNLFIFFLGCTMLYSANIAIATDIDIDTSSSFLYPGFSKKISMDFQDASLVDVLKIFSQQTSINLISSEEIAGKRVTVYLDNVPVEQALEQVLRANSLTYELQPDSNIYIVKPLAKPEIELLTRVYLLKHASVSTARIGKTLKIVYTVDKGTTQEVTESSEGGSSGGSSGGGGEGSPGIMSALKGVITAKGTIVEDSRTNSLTITDIASNFKNIETALAKLDTPVPQVLIEVEMLEVSKEVGDKIGVKFGETPLTFNGGTRAVLYPWNQNKILQKGFEFEEEWTAGTISATGMTAILQFLQTQSDTKNLARPRILTLSNQPAQIKIATQEAIGLTESTTSSQNLATATSSAERVETGVFLTVTPQVDLVNNEITMAVVPKVITTTPSSITTGGVTLKDPEERGSLSILRIASGDTIALGGLLREDHTTVVTKIPFLGDIPFIGAAFRHKTENRENRELIIFLTPHIIVDGLQKNAQTPKRPIFREQSEPSQNRLETVERELSNTQRKKL